MREENLNEQKSAAKRVQKAQTRQLAQYFGAVQILGIENKILKVMIGGTFDFADLLCYAVGCILAGAAEKFESKNQQRRSDG